MLQDYQASHFRYLLSVFHIPSFRPKDRKTMFANFVLLHLRDIHTLLDERFFKTTLLPKPSRIA